MGFSRRRMGALALLLSSALGCDGHLAAPGAGALEPEPVALERVIATGRVEGWREADVGSKIPGRILAFEFEEAQRVPSGAAVVRLEDRDLRSRVAAARARAREAAQSLVRSRALRREGILSAAELDHAEWTARARAAELDEARATLANATLRAPFAGTLLRKYKEVGESVTTGGGPDPAFRIADLSRLKVVTEVPEADIGAVRVGQPGAVTSDAYPGEEFPGRVTRVGLSVGAKRLRSEDPREQLLEKVIEVELTLEPDPRMRSGMTVDVAIDVEKGPSGAAEASAAAAR